MLTNLPPEQRGSYEALTTALDTRFGLSHQTELNWMRLKARTRRRDESLAELAEDVEHLVRLGRMTNQGAKEQTGDVLQQLVDALRQVTKGPSRPQQFPPPRKERNQSDRSNLVCWECKERGHRRRECPKRMSYPAETEVSQSGNEQ